MAAKKTAETIVIPPIKFAVLELRLIGDSFIIPHAWCEKAKRMIRDKGQKTAKGPRENRDPLGDGSRSMYWLGKDGQPIPAGDDWTKHKYGFGVPCRAIKASVRRAAADVEGVAMTQINRLVFVLPLVADACVPLLTGNGKKLLLPNRIREDLMRVGGKGPGTGSADLRYRGEFTNWSTVVEVKFDAGILSKDQIVNLFNRAGQTCGLLEDRAEKTGGYGGLFHVAGAKAVGSAA